MNNFEICTPCIPLWGDPWIPWSPPQRGTIRKVLKLIKVERSFFLTVRKMENQSNKYFEEITNCLKKF